MKTRKLTQNERLVLASCDLRAEADAALLAKESGLQDYSIRYSLRRMRTEQVIRRIPLIDAGRAGYFSFIIYCSLGSAKPGLVQAFLETLKRSPHVIWIGRFAGQYQYGFTLCTKGPGGVYEFLSSLPRKFEGIFFDKSLSCRMTVTAFPRRYLSEQKFSTEPLQLGTAGKTMDLDETDLKILSGMAAEPQLSQPRLAEMIKIPPSTLAARTSRLEVEGVIAGYLYVPNPTVLTFAQFNILISGKGLGPMLAKKLYKFCESHPNIVYLIESIGAWDFEILCEVERDELITDIVHQLYEELGEIISYLTVLPKFADLKSRWFPGRDKE